MRILTIKKSIAKKVLSLMLVLILFGLPIYNLCFATGGTESDDIVLKRSYSDSNLCVLGKMLVFTDEKMHKLIVDTYNDMLEEFEYDKKVSYTDTLYERDLFVLMHFLPTNVFEQRSCNLLDQLLVCATLSGIDSRSLFDVFWLNVEVNRSI